MVSQVSWVLNKAVVIILGHYVERENENGENACELVSCLLRPELVVRKEEKGIQLNDTDQDCEFLFPKKTDAYIASQPVFVNFHGVSYLLLFT